jgi:hypothetical protein
MDAMERLLPSSVEQKRDPPFKNYPADFFDNQIELWNELAKLHADIKQSKQKLPFRVQTYLATHTVKQFTERMLAAMERKEAKTTALLQQVE